MRESFRILKVIGSILSLFEARLVNKSKDVFFLWSFLLRLKWLNVIILDKFQVLIEVNKIVEQRKIFSFLGLLYNIWSLQGNLHTRTAAVAGMSCRFMKILEKYGFWIFKTRISLNWHILHNFLSEISCNLLRPFGQTGTWNKTNIVKTISHKILNWKVAWSVLTSYNKTIMWKMTSNVQEDSVENMSIKGTFNTKYRFFWNSSFNSKPHEVNFNLDNMKTI